MPLPSILVKCYKYIDDNVKNYVDELREIIKIQNVSSDPDAATELSVMVGWMVKRLKQLGFNVKLKQPDYEKYKGNKPLIILGTLGKNPRKKRLMYYCHLDVLKVDREQWDTDPFKLTEKNGKLYGRGAIKMKGPILCFIHAIETYIKLGIDLPINIQLICESMYECKSVGLSDKMLEDLSLENGQVDCVLMTESHWIGKKNPCLVYGTRGVCYFEITITGANKSLPSGDFGGMIHEPMTDLINILKR